MISAVVLTKNEEENIESCLKSLDWCDEIIIVDDYSKDNTLVRIKGLGFRVKGKEGKIKIFKRHLNGDFGAQRNFGLEKAKGEWVLFIDADEGVSEGLQDEILKQVQDDLNTSVRDQIKGYLIKRKDFFLGKWLNYGETSTVRLIRLAKKGGGNWVGKVHEEWKIEGKIIELNEPILHYPHPTNSSFLEKINKYTDIVAQYWLEQGRLISNWEIIFYPAGKFLQNYILRLGFLDGIPGLIMAAMMSFHSFLARGKLWFKLRK